MSLPIARQSALGLLILAGSCTDVLAPLQVSSGGALKTIDVSVATVSLDLIYNGSSIGQNFAPPGTLVVQGDRCFNFVVDGVVRTQACGSTEIQNLTPGSHTIALQDYVQVPGNPIGTLVDVAPPVTVTLVGGTITPISFDISAARGKLTGLVQINGAAPPDFQYNLCMELGSCSQLVGGAISVFARPGSSVARVRSMAALTSILDIPFTAVAGTTVDLGTFNVQFGSLTLDLLYDGASIGPSFGPPGTSVVQGDRCFSVYVDGTYRTQACGPTTVSDLLPGNHTVALKDNVPVPGNPIDTQVDVAPPVTLTLVGGSATPVAFDITGARGKLTGLVRINGIAPPDFQYNLCMDAGSCSQLVGGAISLFVRPGNGVGHVRAMAAVQSILDIPFTGVAGTTVDVGTLNVQFGSVTLDILYNGATIGQSFGPPGTLTAQGERCFSLTVDGQYRNQFCGPATVSDIPPGVHTIGLQDLVPIPGNPIGTAVNVQPPVTVTIVSGASTPVAFDVSAVRGKIDGGVLINGSAPPDNQYSICLESSSCGQLTGGHFTMFARVGSGRGSLRAMPSTTLAEFTFIVAAGNTTLIGGVSTAAPGSTPSGSNVSVLPVNQTTGTSNTTVGLTFNNVTTPGTTTVVQSNTGAPPPTGLQLGTPPVYFNISSNATFSGPVEVCINYTGTTFDAGATIELLHGEADGSWTVVTTSHNAVDRIICGSVTSFSPFVVAKRTATPTVPPAVSPTVNGTLGVGNWYTSDVTVRWNVAGNGTPITNKTGCDDALISSNTTGTTLTCTATSAGGSKSQSVTIKRDANGPTVTPTVSGAAGSNGWYLGNVSVSWVATDPTSGVTSTPCASSTMTEDSHGTTYTCTATNGAGQSTTASTTSIQRDATAPVVTYAGNAGTYTVDQSIAITCSATDATSGVATSTCHDVSGTAYNFDPGLSVYSATATDNAGNTGSGSASFRVIVTTDALCRLTTSMAGDVAKSLCAKLDAAGASLARGNTNAAQNQINAYLNELRAQSGKKISAENAAILARLASGL